MTSGTTKTVEVLMDGMAVLHRAQRHVTALIAAVDEALRKSVAADPLLRRAEDDLRRALELSNTEDKDANILRALSVISEAFSARLQDTSLPRVRAAVAPYDEALTKHLKAFGDLVKALTSKEGVAHFLVDDEPVMPVKRPFWRRWCR